MRTRVVILVCGLVFLGAGRASAQLAPWKDRAFVNVSGGFQPASHDTKTSFSFSLYEEAASVSAVRTLKGGAFLDLMGGVRIWNNFGIGAGFLNHKSTADAVVTGSIPDPIQFDSPRAVNTTLALRHDERWSSIFACYMLSATVKIDVLLFAGGSVATVDHEVPTAVSVTESNGPKLAFTNTTLRRSVWGSMAGADVRYMFSRSFGAGAFVRFEATTANLAGDVKIDMGGLQAGVGVRFRY